MKTTLSILALFIIGLNQAIAQDLGEFKPDITKYGLSNIRKAPKKIYISSFNINYEVYKDAVDYKAAGGFRNNKTSEATARAAVGLGGVQTADTQAAADKLYLEFVSDLNAAGYKIITIDQAENTDIYKNWKKSSGPYIIESGMPGVLTVIPEGYSFMYKGETKSGKKKKGFLGGVGVPAALSKQLDDAIIAEVNLNVMFTEDKESLFKGRAAKVKILTNLRLVDAYAITSEKKTGFIRLKGATTVDRVNSNITFYQGKTGLGSKGQYTVGLKKPLEINNVMGKEKIVAYQKAGSSSQTSFSMYSEMDLASRFSTTAKWIDVDSKAYADGLYNACGTLLKTATSNLKSL